MSLLMPEYERQLRATARRLAANPAATGAPVSRGGLGSRVFLTVSAAVAVLVAVAAVVWIGHHSSPSQTVSGTALPAVQYDCAPHQVLRPIGPLVAIAHGAVGGQRWTLEVDSARRGLRSVQAGRLQLGGHAYGFCTADLDVELVNAGTHGVVYGIAAPPYRPPIAVEATNAKPSAAHPGSATTYPATSRQVRGVTLFLRALPASACTYHQLAVAAPEKMTSAGASEAVMGMASFVGSCAPGQLLRTPQEGSGPSTPQIAAPAGLSAQARAEFYAGRTQIGNSGCLACHRLADQGNNGPGPDLTHIGRILNARALESALVNPTPPMPSFKSLDPRSRRALIAFLRDLR